MVLYELLQRTAGFRIQCLEDRFGFHQPRDVFPQILGIAAPPVILYLARISPCKQMDVAAIFQHSCKTARRKMFSGHRHFFLPLRILPQIALLQPLRHFGGCPPDIAIRRDIHQEMCFFAWDKTNFLQEPGLTLTVPRGMLYDNVALHQLKKEII